MDRPQIERRKTEIVSASLTSSFRRWRVLRQLQYPMFFRWMTEEDREDVVSRIEERRV